MTGRWYDRPGKPARQRPRDLPTHFALTDPRRFPDTLSFADAIPDGWGVIYRHFGAPDRARVAIGLSQLAETRGWVLLVANDPELALGCGAHGVHWPERQHQEAVRWRRSQRNSILTMSAHSGAAVRRAAQLGADAAFLSPVRQTASPGSGTPLGWLRAGTIARRSNLPVFALGGLTAHDAQHAWRLGFSGLGMISGVTG